MVKFPDVFVQEEAPPEAITNTPVELPRLVAAVPVALMLVMPVTVSPPVPCRRPEPELTPTATTAPALETEKLGATIKLPKVPVKLIPVDNVPAVLVSWIAFDRVPEAAFCSMNNPLVVVSGVLRLVM